MTPTRKDVEAQPQFEDDDTGGAATDGAATGGVATDPGAALMLQQHAAPQRGPVPRHLLDLFPADARAQWMAFCWALTGSNVPTERGPDLCSVCGLPQEMTPHGAVCHNGHGGAPPMETGQPALPDPVMYVRLLGERADVPRHQNATGKPVVQARRVQGPASELWPRLQAANARGWAVYVQVNEPVALPSTGGGAGGKGGGRWSKQRFPMARAVTTEIDAKNPCTSEQAQARKALPLPTPTLIVASRGGPHLWWVLPAPLPAVVAETLSAGAAQLLGGDPDVWDRARVLRAPGFFHWKQPDGFFVRLVGGTGQPVDPHALAAPLPEPTHGPAVEPARPTERPGFEQLVGEERQWALQECAKILAVLGPSVEGKGGDNHLYRRVIPALQDHGLSWDDALPLLHGWNATCAPPWPGEVLREKWRRAWDVREEGPRAIELRRMQASIDELLTEQEEARALLDAQPATGGNPRPFDNAVGEGPPGPNQGPPPPAGPPPPGAGPQRGGDGRTEIHYRPGVGLLETVRECLAALAEPLSLWDYNGVLARTSGQRLVFGLGGRELIRANLQAHVQLFTFTEDSRRKRAPLTAYKDVAKCLAEIEDVTGLLPRVKTVCLHPQVLPDGEAVSPSTRQQRVVYDRETQTVFLLAPAQGEVGTPPDCVGAARVARDALLDLVVDFPFASPADKSAWLAALLTVFSRRAIRGPAPLFLFEGNQSGAGKSLLADVVLAIQGAGYAATHWQGDAYQDTAQLFGMMQAAVTTVFLDNVSGQFGDVVLDSLLTGESFTGRLLGGATQVTVDTGALTWLVTGNNLIARRDLARRTLRAALVNTTPPDQRRAFRYPHLIQHVKANRAFYQSCVLTMLAGYVRAGAPPPPEDGVQFRSFDAWSAFVRGCLHWLGLPDVFEGADNENLDRAVLGDDESETELEREAVVRAVLDVCGAVAKGTEDIVQALADPMAMGNPALAPLLGLLKNKRLPYLLRTHHRAVTRDGWQLKSARKSRWAKRCWYVERAWTPPPGAAGVGGEADNSPVDIGHGPVQGGAQNTTNNVLPFKR